MKVIYFHGFGSVGTGFKSIALRKKFGTYNVDSPDLPVDPDKVIPIIDKLIDENEGFPTIFVGTSLGGFWANYFSKKYNSPCVIVNPLVKPSEYLGKENVSPEIIEKYKQIENVDNDKMLINMFVASDDEVLNVENMLEHFKNIMFTAIFPDGGHRFEKHWHNVIYRIEDLTQQW